LWFKCLHYTCSRAIQTIRVLPCNSFFIWSTLTI
jgi:hypothetical protein